VLEVGGGEDAGDDVLRDAEAAEVMLPAALVDITRMRRRINMSTQKL
jgi:D-serine deaminase-like pyridoxal phosphate-dependent protein